VTNNDVTRINFDKHIPLRSESGELLGEAMVTMKHGEILITGQFNPNTEFARKLMATNGSFSIATPDEASEETPTRVEGEIDYGVFEQ
jgi:hypothetical protein